MVVRHPACILCVSLLAAGLQPATARGLPRFVFGGSSAGKVSGATAQSRDRASALRRRATGLRLDEEGQSCSVRMKNGCRGVWGLKAFVTDVMKPLSIADIIDNEVQNLSGGELQRVAIALSLGKPADIYLIDEPSAYLDSEQRIACAKLIKRFVLHAKKTAFVVEHDFIMATYLADRVIVYDGEPGIETTANSPQGLLSGMNTFLDLLRITFRRDPTNFRPRINKMDSIKDREQKASGNFFFMDSSD